ncbi:hypothetical protein RA307_31410 [Xanthobacteraceae bacterium Astr-EGSB]|uniref:hypothetical protein n=1 Tax=Astrobacterium formosum TaxID=3069710 RepID=UPI0027B60998|nr:hypothetical protein [Xanthobacteraceae bacterium Astr-EGSB]
MGSAFEIDIRANFDNIAQAVNEMQRDNIPFVTAYALTKTAQDVRVAEVDKMREVFDRPTRFALNALQVVPATKQDLRAAVVFKQGFGSIPAERYLGPQVHGGGRAKKSHERALQSAGILGAAEYCVPGKAAPLDAFGNMKGGDFTRILSQLQASRDPMQNMTPRSRRRAIKRAGGQYFVLRGAGRAPDGIYKRVAGGAAEAVLIFVRAPSYTARLPYEQTAFDVVERQLPVHFAEGWARYGNQRRRA